MHKIYKVCVLSVDTGKGEIKDFYVVEGGDFVMVVALTPAKEVILVREYKHGGDVAVAVVIPRAQIASTNGDRISFYLQ